MQGPHLTPGISFRYRDSLTDRVMDHLATRRTLTSVDLSGCKLTDAIAGVLTQCPLQVLILSRCTQLQRVNFSTCEQLKRVDFSYCTNLRDEAAHRGVVSRLVVLRVLGHLLGPKMSAVETPATVNLPKMS